MNHIHSKRIPRDGVATQKEFRSLIRDLREGERELLQLEMKAFNEHRALADALGIMSNFRRFKAQLSSQSTRALGLVQQEIGQLVRELEEGNIPALVRRVNAEYCRVTSHCSHIEGLIDLKTSSLGSELSGYLQADLRQVRDALDLLTGNVLLQLIRAYRIPVRQTASASVSPQPSTLSGRANASVEAMEMFLECREALWSKLYLIQSKAFDAIEQSRQRSIDAALPLLKALATANAEVEELQGRALPAQKPVLPSGVSEVGTDWFSVAHGVRRANILHHINGWNRRYPNRRIEISGSFSEKGVYRPYGGNYLFPLQALAGEVSADDFNDYLWNHRCPGRGKRKK